MRRSLAAASTFPSAIPVAIVVVAINPANNAINIGITKVVVATEAIDIDVAIAALFCFNAASIFVSSPLAFASFAVAIPTASIALAAAATAAAGSIIASIPKLIHITAMLFMAGRAR